MIDQNPGTISLGQGVVFYQPPEEIHRGIEKFSSTNAHYYKAVEGIPEFRNLIATKLFNENGINTNNYETVVCAGSNMGFLNSVLAISDIGDEIIILKPWFFNHEMAIRLANCVPISVDTNANYQPDVVAIEHAITPNTRAIVTVSPNNPSGAVYPARILKEINQICSERNIYHIHDEAYEYFCYNGRQHYSPASDEAVHRHTISLFSTSKSFGFANWRIGYMLIPKDLFLSIRKIQDTNLICPPVVSQYAAMECLHLGRNYCDPKIRQIDAVRKYFASQMAQLPNIRHGPMDGAFYGLLELPYSQMEDMQVVEYLIKNHLVAVIPGAAFGIEDRCCIRVSYAALEPSTVEEGLNRLTSGLKELMSNSS